MERIKLGTVNGRHQMPVDGYILDQVTDPADIDAINKAVCNKLTAVFQPFMAHGTANIPNATEYVDVPVMRCEGAHLDLYVTGLTSVALAAVTFCRDNMIPVTAWHYNTVTGDYIEQKL